jgi:hypothetical protein
MSSAIAGAPSVSADELERLLYRFGFLLHASRSPPTGALWQTLSRTWRTLDLDDLSLRHHPETVVRVERSGADFTALIGEAWVASPPYERSPVRMLADQPMMYLPRTLDELSGRFVAIVRRDGRTSVFHDAFGSRAVFYLQDGPLALASNAELLAEAFGAPRSRAMAEYLESQTWKGLSMRYLPGDLTTFERVFMLVPNNLYDIERRKTQRYWPRKAQAASEPEAFSEGCDRYFAGLAAFLRDRHPWLSVTGGIDSRVLIAALGHFGCDFRTVTWTTFNFKEWEAQPVAAITALLGGRHAMVDGTNDAINAVAMIGVRNGGQSRPPSPAVAGMSRLAGEDPRAIFIRGFGGEVLRGFYNAHDRPIDGYTPTAMAERYRQAGRDADTFLLAAFEGFHKRANANAAAGFGVDPNDLFYWEHRVGTWAPEQLNAMDAAVYSMYGFNSRPLAEIAFGLPKEKRLTKTLFLDVVRRYNPQLADIYYE